MQSHFIDPGGKIEGLRNILEPECANIGYAIVVPLLVMQVMIIGLMGMQRYSFTDQLGALLIRVMIVVLILSSVPQNILRTAVPKLTQGGKEVGGQIVASTGISRVQSVKDDPVKYWAKWLGDPSQEGTLFNVDTLMKMFEEPPPPERPTTDPTDEGSGERPWYDIFGHLLDAAGEVLDKILKVAKEIFYTLVSIVAPFFILGFLIAITMMQIGAYFAPAMMQITTLVGTHYLLEIILCFGIASAPLAFLDFSIGGVGGGTSSKTTGVWLDWLMFSTGLALVPVFYYVFSGIGFQFATSTFDLLFPEVAAVVGDPNPGGTGFGILMRKLLEDGIQKNAAGMMGQHGEISANVVMLLLDFYINLLKYLFFGAAGTMMISTTVASGVGFASLATAAAANWYKMFAFDGLQEQVSNTMNQLQGSVGTGLGQAYGQGFSSLTNMAGGMTKGLGRIGRR